MNCCKPRYLGCHMSGTPIAGTALIIPITICVDELKQGDCFDFIIPCCFDYPDCIENVMLFINNTASLFAIKFGAVKSDQIRNRRKYKVVVGTEFNTATILNDLPCSKFSYPEIDVTTTAIANVAQTRSVTNTPFTNKKGDK